MEKAGIAWRAFIATILIIGACILFINVATAQAFCPPGQQPYAGVVKMLTEKYGESKRVVGLVRPGQNLFVEIWAAPNEGTWTIIARYGDCAKHIADGQVYKFLENQGAAFIPGRDA